MQMTLSEKLTEAQRRVKEAEAALKVDIFSADLREQYKEAEMNLLTVERLVAAAQGLPHAVEWKPGRRIVMILDAELICRPSIATIIFEGTDGKNRIEFPNYYGARDTRINDEVIAGHP